ncbi:MAG TPA: zf-HC2 domain-containing protein [Ktedonobacterales bacterium]|nr:zf-HC2 domain-containing protein [Ktedonobacterales bacterium]
MNLPSHAAIRELLPSYAANQLAPGERAAIERHIATCAECRAELREWLTLGEWLAQADAAIPSDTSAAPGLAAIHARLRQPPAHSLNGFDHIERSALPTMSDQDYPRYSPLPQEEWTSTTIPERRSPAAPFTDPPSAPDYPQPPQRRISPLAASTAALAFLALAAVLFYLLAPQNRPRNNVANQPAITGTWHAATSAPAHTVAMRFAPTAPQTGYLCAVTNPVPSSPHWLYKTTDGGKTWRPLSVGAMPSAGQPASMNCDIFINASDANDVFAQLLLSKLEGSPQVLSETVWRSRDGGRSWRQMSLPHINNGWASLVVVGSRIVALAANDQQIPPICSTNSSGAYPSQLDYLYASDNGGATWSKIGQSLTSQGASIVAAGVIGPALTSAGDTLFVQTYCAASQGQAGGDRHATWKSTDGGANWSKVALPSDAYIMGFTRATSGGYVGAAVEQSVGGGSPSTALPVVYSSADTGASWKALPSLKGMPGLNPVIGHTSVMWAIALPDGAILAAVNVYDTNSAVKSSGVFAINLRSAKHTWWRFASFDNQTPLDIGATGQGLVLWALSTSDTAPVAYLSPLP